MKINLQSLFRNSEPHLDRVLKQMESLKDVCDVSFNFYENDSTDNTLEILSEFGATVYYEKLNAPLFGSIDSNIRTSMLAYYRNKLKRLTGHVDADYVLLVDSDLFFEAKHLEGLIKSIERLDCAMVTPNTQQNVPDFMFNTSDTSYYDVYCFRDMHGRNGAYFSSCPFYNKKDLMRWSDGEPVRTFSSFAGFTLIRADVYNKVWWSADMHSEHVNFCAEVNDYGKIYADPNIKTSVYIDLSKYNLENMKKIAENQRNNFEVFNILNDASRKEKYDFYRFVKKDT